MAFDPNNPELRNAAVRKGEFRETARDIVWRDRQSKRGGSAVDTGGAITRAMEQAYKLGLEHGRNQQPESNDALLDPDAPLPWNSIPPRSRDIFERILSMGWVVALNKGDGTWQRPRDQWNCYWDHSNRKNGSAKLEFAESFSATTLAPVIKLGLMEKKSGGGHVFLLPTEKGKATWQRAIDDGHISRPLG